MQVIRHRELAADIRDIAIHYAEVSERVLSPMRGLGFRLFFLLCAAKSNFPMNQRLRRFE
jgi:hypothetical protein